MSGFLSCPACGTSGIALGATSCPGCRVGFSTPVVQPTHVPAATAVAVATHAEPVPARVAQWEPTASYPPATGQQEYVEYASLWQRFVAGVIDELVLAVPFLLVFGWNSASESGFYMDTSPESFLSLLVAWLYYAGMQSAQGSSTLGMRVMKLRVLGEDDLQPISFLRATGRHFAAFISAIILLIGYIMIAFTRKHQGLHDKLARTVVVRDLDRIS